MPWAAKERNFGGWQRFFVVCASCRIAATDRGFSSFLGRITRIHVFVSIPMILGGGNGMGGGGVDEFRSLAPDAAADSISAPDVM